jgi:hypothetical protein
MPAKSAATIKAFLVLANVMEGGPTSPRTSTYTLRNDMDSAKLDTAMTAYVGNHARADSGPKLKMRSYASFSQKTVSTKSMTLLNNFSQYIGECCIYRLLSSDN